MRKKGAADDLACLVQRIGDGLGYPVVHRSPGQLTQRVELAEAKAAEKRASSQ